MGTRGEGSPYGRNVGHQRRWGPGQVERFDRDRKCVEMRAAGNTWDEITEALGYASPGHARDRWTLMLERMPSRGDMEEQRELELQRLDRMAVALEPKIANGDVRAVEVGIKLLERRARLIGADQPVRQQITVINDELAAELVTEWRAQLEASKRRAIEAGIDPSIIDGEVVEEPKTVGE